MTGPVLVALRDGTRESGDSTILGSCPDRRHPSGRLAERLRDATDSNKDEAPAATATSGGALPTTLPRR